MHRNDETDEIVQYIENLLKLQVAKSVSGASKTTFKIGGCFEYLLIVNSNEELSVILQFFYRSAFQEYRVIGNGSNLLIPDEGLRGVTLVLGRQFKRYTFEDTSIQEALKNNDSGKALSIIQSKSKRTIQIAAGAATSLMTLSRDVAHFGLAGFEFAGGIPGSTGGAVRMNAGAHGSDISQVLTAVEGVTCTGEIKKYTREEMSFRYRFNSLPKDFVITAAEFTCPIMEAREVSEKRAHYLKRRKATQPLTMPSAGSVFKNPETVESKESSIQASAGALIEQTGLKGHTIGGAQISELHANWIVNRSGSASYYDVLSLIKESQRRVMDSFGITLIPEIIVLAP
jgi:UDP-N-acetylmuramate dehydrogenase